MLSLACWSVKTPLSARDKGDRSGRSVLSWCVARDEDYEKYVWTVAEEEAWVSASFAAMVFVSQWRPRSFN